MSVNLSKIITSLRKEKGYTQEKLSEMLGVSTAAVSKWETGNSYPDIFLLPKIAEIFNVSVDYLFDYDSSVSKNVDKIISASEALRKGGEIDEAISSLSRALVHYPNNDRLIFELAYHNFISSWHKNQDKRKEALKSAEKGFILAIQNTCDGKLAAKAYHFLTVIAINQLDYDKAREYNSHVVGAEGIYPRVDKAIIDFRQFDNAKSLELSNKTLYEIITEYSLLETWRVNFFISHKEPDRAILEAERAIFILDKFNENELFGNELSVFSESMALAYAMNSDYENCMLQLEKAVDYADKYDNAGCSGSDERASSVKSLLSLLGSDVRKEYSPIRNTKRFAAILNK